MPNFRGLDANRVLGLRGLYSALTMLIAELSDFWLRPVLRNVMEVGMG